MLYQINHLKHDELVLSHFNFVATKLYLTYIVFVVKVFIALLAPVTLGFNGYCIKKSQLAKYRCSTIKDLT